MNRRGIIIQEILSHLETVITLQLGREHRTIEVMFMFLFKFCFGKVENLGVSMLFYHSHKVGIREYQQGLKVCVYCEQIMKREEKKV